MALTIKQIKKGLEANAGFISGAAKSLGVTYQAIHNRINKDKELKDFYDAITESHLDLAESKLLSNIKDGNMTGICFFLKCKGKARGYIEKQNWELSGPGGGPIKVETSLVDMSKLTDEELASIAKLSEDDS